MPSNWSMIDVNFPNFTGNEKPREQIAALQDYMMLLVEQLKYQLNNLDASNWNDAALEDMKGSTTARVETELSNLAADLSRITESLGKLTQELGYVEQDVEELKERLDGLDGDISNLMAVVQPDGTGSADLGKDGQELRLWGKVYVNGILLEGGTA